MPAKFLFWTVPCVYMVYMIYVALFLISVLLLFKTNVGANDSQIKKRVKRLIQRKKQERLEEFQRICEIYNYNNYRATSKPKPESESEQDDETETAKFSHSELLEFQEITSLPFHELREKLQRGEVTAVKVLHAFIAKTVQVTERLNCITEFWIPQAIEMAENLDILHQETGDVENRPLFGIPVVIKDDHDIQGMDSTLGLGQNLYKPSLSSSALVQSLVALGCVPFAKTNVPQTLLSNGSHNPIFGETKNPLNPNISPAGSSSGSASLVCAGGALISTGSDFGGSLRTPAHNCGISSIKPTIGRLSAKGIRICQPAIGLPSVPGILAKNAETVAFVFKHLTMSGRQHSIDETCPPIPWNEKLFDSKKKLRMGYITSLPFFPAMGDTAQTILDAKDALENEGHFLTPFEMPDSFELAKIFTDLSFADGGEYLKNLLRKEPDLSPDFIEFWPTLFMSKWKKDLLGWLIGQSWFPGYSKRISMLIKGGTTSSADLWRVWQRINELRNEILDKMKASQLDAILSPVFAFAAITPEDNRKLIMASYTMTWSCLDFPVGVTRFGTESGQKINEYDDEGDSILKEAKKAFPSSIGMPIGIQVISQPFHEETILRLLSKLDSLYKKRKIE